MGAVKFAAFMEHPGHCNRSHRKILFSPMPSHLSGALPFNQIIFLSCGEESPTVPFNFSLRSA